MGHDQTIATDTDPHKLGEDKLWLKTGTLFFETDRNGEPSDLKIGTKHYSHVLLGRDGNRIGSLEFDDRQKLVAALETLYGLGLIHKAEAGVGENVSGYLVSLDVAMTIHQVIAGLDVQKNQEVQSGTPIVITTDGSFRHEAKAGGGHAIIARRSSTPHKDDFRICLTWEAQAKTSYEAELRAILEALRYLEGGKQKKLAIEIRTDERGIIPKLTQLAKMPKHLSGKLPFDQPEYQTLWKEIAKIIAQHDITVVETHYNAGNPDTVQVHQEAHAASRRQKTESVRTKPIASAPAPVESVSQGTPPATAAPKRDHATSPDSKQARRLGGIIGRRRDRHRINRDLQRLAEGYNNGERPSAEDRPDEQRRGSERQ